MRGSHLEHSRLTRSDLTGIVVYSGVQNPVAFRCGVFYLSLQINAVIQMQHRQQQPFVRPAFAEALHRLPNRLRATACLANTRQPAKKKTLPFSVKTAESG